MFSSREEAEAAVAAGAKDVYERWDYDFVAFYYANFRGDLLLGKEVSWGGASVESGPRVHAIVVS